jgi:hypothetical protein
MCYSRLLVPAQSDEQISMFCYVDLRVLGSGRFAGGSLTPSHHWILRFVPIIYQIDTI